MSEQPTVTMSKEALVSMLSNRNQRIEELEEQLAAYERVIKNEIAGRIVSSVAAEQLQTIFEAAIGEVES